MNLVDRALALREGGYTTRCHTTQYIGPYNVAIHSYNALSLLLLLYGPEAPSIHLIKAVQWHDTAERWTGDVPTPAKMASPNLKASLVILEQKVFDALGLTDLLLKLTHEEKQWLDAVDLLELYMWAKEQYEMGNKTVYQMILQILIIFGQKEDTIPQQVKIFLQQFKWDKTPECHELIGGIK